MKEIFSALESCPLFRGMGHDEIGAAVSEIGAKTVSYSKAESIINEGDAPEFLGIVLSGRVSVSRSDYNGNRSVIGMISEGGLFAEAYVCSGAESVTVAVSAVEPCEIMQLSAKSILSDDYCCRCVIVQNLLRITASKNLMLNEKIEVISKRTIRGKLLAYLTIQAKKAGSAEFTIPFDRQSLADYIEADRSAVAAEIAKLRKEGVLESSRSRFKLNFL